MSEVMETNWQEQAEFHAFSVRQMIKQRDRLHTLLSALGQFGTFPNGTTMAEIADAVPHSTSQFFQDVFALIHNQGKHGGYAVEFGACDGLTMSNTVMLEREFGWTCLLAEPSRHWQRDLQTNRTAKIETRCVAPKSGDYLTFSEAEHDHTQSTTAAHMPAASVGGRSYNVETISLFDMLRHHKAPRIIDYLSCDTEGSEHAILEAFFTENAKAAEPYRINFLTVEHHGDAIEGPMKAMLERAGLKQVFRAASGHDGFYVPA
jgi:FkbM family methyltransferase